MEHINVNEKLMNDICSSDIIAELQDLIHVELSKDYDKIDIELVDECVNALLEIEKEEDSSFLPLVPLLKKEEFLNRIITKKSQWKNLNRFARVSIIAAVIAGSTLTVNAAVDAVTGVNLIENIGDAVQVKLEDWGIVKPRHIDQFDGEDDVEDTTQSTTQPTTEMTTVKAETTAAKVTETTAKRGIDQFDGEDDEEDTTTTTKRGIDQFEGEDDDDETTKPTNKPVPSATDKTPTDKYQDKDKVVLASLKAEFDNFKTDYIYGETLTYDGIKLTAYYSDGSEKQISLDDCTYTKNPDMNATADYTLKIGYQSCHIMIDITVRPDEDTRGSQIKSNSDYDYLLTDKGAYIVKYKGEQTAITLDSVDGSRVFALSANVFENLDLTYFESNTVEKILDYAFKDCGKLTRCIIPNAYYIGNGAFENDKMLENASFAPSLNFLGNKAYKNTAVSELSIPAGITEIPSGLCENCPKLATVEFLGQVRAIGDSAFSECPSLESVTGTKYLKAVGDFAFYNDSKAAVDSQLELLESAGAYAFAYCNNLGVESLPSTIKNMGDWCFAYCYELKKVVIPAGITEIPYVAFRGAHVSSVTLNEGLLKIDDYAFYQSGLSALNVPDSVETIGAYAFNGCKNLQTVQLGSDSRLNSIGQYAFAASAVKCFNLPKSIAAVSNYAFLNCTNLEEFTFPSICDLSVINSSVFSGCSALKSIHIPFCISAIGANAFQNCTALESVRIDNAYVVINKSAFSVNKNTMFYSYGISNTAAYAKNILSSYTDVTKNELHYANHGTWENGDWSVDKTATDIVLTIRGFGDISSNEMLAYTGAKLTFGTVCIKYGVTKIVFDNAITSIPDYFTYSNGSDQATIKTVVFGDNVTSIGEYAFYGCTSLKSIKLNNGLTEIKNSAFCNTGLTNVVIPDSVTTLGSRAFGNCKNLEIIKIGANVTEIFCEDGQTKNNAIGFSSVNGSRYTKLVFSCPKHCAAYDYAVKYGFTVDEIEDVPDLYGYFGNDASNAVTWKYYAKENVIYIEGEGRFTAPMRYANGKWVNPGEFEVDKAVVCEGVTGVYAKQINNKYISPFYYMQADSVEFPSSLVSIGYQTFVYDGVEHVKISEGTESISSEAFYKCNTLKTLTLPSTVTSIGNNAFRNCQYLEAIQLPDGITTIGDRAFYSCTSLKAVDLPEQLETIGSRVQYFYPGQDNAFLDIAVDSENPYFYTYDHCLYNADNELVMASVLRDSVTIRQGTTKIGNHAFSDTMAKRIAVPEGVTEIGNYAFGGSQTKSFILPKTLKTIGSGAFSYNYNLRTIEIPSSVETIGSSAFFFCTKLASIILGDSVQFIGTQCFQHCNKLEYIYMNNPETLEKELFRIQESGGYYNNSPYITIYTVAGSNAHAYARTYRVKFVAYANEDVYYDEYAIKLDTLAGYLGYCTDGHGEIEYLTVYQGDCENDGYIIGVCEYCSKILTEKHVKATGHNYEVTADIPATECTKGVTVHTCTNCSDTYCDYTDPLDDNFVQESHTVTGRVVAATDKAASTGVSPAQNVNVVIDGKTVAKTDKNGVFTCTLDTGVYTAQLVYAYGFARTIYIVVEDQDYTFAEPIPIIGCDFNRDGRIDDRDLTLFNYIVSSKSRDPAYLSYVDMNNDGYINMKDRAYIIGCKGISSADYTYPAIVLSK